MQSLCLGADQRCDVGLGFGEHGVRAASGRFDLPANRQWLDAQTGMLVPVGDMGSLAGALERLCRDDAVAQGIGRANHERMLRDGARSVQMDAMAASYQQLLSSHRRVA